VSTVLFSATGCGTSEGDDDASCACGDYGCPEDVCSIGFDVPASCLDLFETADVLVDGSRVGRATPGTSFETCTATLNVGESASVQVRAPDVFESPVGQATCEVGGDMTPAGFCTLRFDLADSCRGLVEEAVLVVDGVEVGTTRIDDPGVPCVLVTVGTEVSGTIRAGSSYVLTAPLRCNQAGAQPRLTMECQL